MSVENWHMKKTKIDELGRVVIPIDWRRELNLASRDTLELTFDGEKITIKKEGSVCRLCSNVISDECDVPLCADCILKIRKLTI